MRGHSPRCSNAKSPECHCWCAGQFHGTGTGVSASWTPSKKGRTTYFSRKLKKPKKIRLSRWDLINEFDVGEIVEINKKAWHKDLAGKLAFVEEVVTPARMRNGKLPSKWHSGTYSLYGFTKVKFTYDSSFYYGDHKGYELKSAGGRVTKEALEKIKSEDPHNKGLRKDIDKVIKQLFGDE